jgi:hypothetical protein
MAEAVPENFSINPEGFSTIEFFRQAWEYAPLGHYQNY